MNRERTLAAVAVGLVAVALLTAAALPGVLADREPDRPVRPGPVQVVEAPVSVGAVTGETAELILQTHLRHAGPPTPNVTIRFRAIDTDSGLLVTEHVVDVGTVAGDGERVVTQSLTVPREGGYRLEAVVFRNGTRVDSFQTNVAGMRALTPEYARSNASFTDDEVLPAVSVSVADVSDNRTTLSVAASLTATGPVDGDLSVTLVLRQVESNLVAARETTAVGEIREGRTVQETTELTVPSGYNYYVDAVLSRDGVVIDTARGVVNLDPERSVPQNETREDVEFQVGDFDDDGDDRNREDADTPMATETDGAGFGVGVATAAVLGTVLLFRRWSP